MVEQSMVRGNETFFEEALAGVDQPLQTAEGRYCVLKLKGCALGLQNLSE